MQRREFFHAVGGAVAGASVMSRSPARGAARPAAHTKLARVGLELYSVRNAMHRDPERTLAAVRAMGYNDVELLWSFGNFDRTAQQVRAALDREGLRAPSAHMSAATLFVGWQRSLDTARLLGHEYLIVPSFTPETNRTIDD